MIVTMETEFTMNYSPNRIRPIETKHYPTTLTNRAVFPFPCFLPVPTIHSYLDNPKEEICKSLFFFFLKFFYFIVFIFGCVRSSLLCVGFL